MSYLSASWKWNTLADCDRFGQNWHLFQLSHFVWYVFFNHFFLVLVLFSVPFSSNSLRRYFLATGINSVYQIVDAILSFFLFLFFFLILKSRRPISLNITRNSCWIRLRSDVNRTRKTKCKNITYEKGS